MPIDQQNNNPSSPNQTSSPTNASNKKSSSSSHHQDSSPRRSFGQNSSFSQISNGNTNPNTINTNNTSLLNQQKFQQEKIDQLLNPVKKPHRMLSFCASHACFPKIASLASTDFKLTHGTWQVSRAHRKAARWVFYKQLNITNAYTVEISLFGLENKHSGIQLFTPRRAEWIGVALGRSLVPFLNRTEKHDAPAPTLPFLTFNKLQVDRISKIFIVIFNIELFHR